MPPIRIRSGEDLGPGLRTIARIVDGCRAAIDEEDRKAARRANPNQIRLGQVMVLVTHWAIAAAILRSRL